MKKVDSRENKQTEISLQEIQIETSIYSQNTTSSDNNGALVRHYGTMLPFLLDDKFEPKYVLGPHYYVFFPTILLCGWFLWYSITNFEQKLKLGFYPIMACTFSALFFIVSYIRIGFSNPGIASSYYLPDEQTRLNTKYCKPCRVLKIDQTSHCYYCDVCILQMDHHCPWIGKCVGKNNMSQFKIFIFSVILVLGTFGVCIFVFSHPTPPHYT